jgi:hypothetical protein
MDLGELAPQVVDITNGSIPTGPFAAVKGHRTADVFLQTATTDLTALSGQADLKGSIMITSTSLILSVSVATMRYHEVRYGVGTLSIFALAALVMAILAILPAAASKSHVVVDPDKINPLYFRHAAQLTPEQYADRMAYLLQGDTRMYEAMVAQIHSLSVHLETKKFARLRLGYIILVAGFVTASVVQAVALALGA